jgi:2-phospho-L-lactate guanylyltransferase
MPSRSVPDDAGIIIPVRSFARGKARLAEVLDEDARSTLARTMAERVVEAANGRPTVIVSSAPEVRTWATTRGLDVLDDPGSLDGAAIAGRAWARDRDLARYAIVHADLPHATSLDAVIGDGAHRVAVIVPDHRDDGTPVLALPTAIEYTFAYGPDSAARHIAEAERCGLTVRVVHDPDLAFDVDVPADLARLAPSELTPPR